MRFTTDRIVRPLGGNGEGVATGDVAWFGVAANQNLFSALAADSAADRLRTAPNELRIMRNILDAASAAVRGERPGRKISFLRNPKVDHRLRTEGAWRTTPDILPFKGTTWKVRRMFELSRFGKMIGPSLRPLCELVVPAKRGHADQHALTVVGFQNALVEVAKARLRSGQ